MDDIVVLVLTGIRENGMKGFLQIEQFGCEFAELGIRTPYDADMSKDLESSAFRRRSR
jgi:hypothetical protein